MNTTPRELPFRIRIASADPELRPGLDEIVRAFPWRFSTEPDAVPVNFHAGPSTDGPALRLRREPDGGWRIDHTRPAGAFRALGILMGWQEAGGASPELEERTPFRSLGVMLDASRNGVPRVATVQRLLRHFALTGINWLLLYMEDVYTIPEEPHFGYCRGRYTHDELVAIDRYAARFGIEVVPCIQTLGHLEQILRWPRFRPLRDTGGVLCARDPEVEKLIAKMIDAASAPFRSKRIHVGMDEAHGVGTGAYRRRHGYEPPFETLVRHLDHVAGLCRERGLHPLIWSDMFFRLGSRDNEYYDLDAKIPPGVAERIPANVDLVYWDYYHTDPAFYDEWIRRHRALGAEPVFAGGIWTWNRFWATLPTSFATLRAGVGSARRAGLKDAFAALWGDDGMECNLLSALPAAQYFADLAYGSDLPLDRQCRGSCDLDSDAWIRASDIDPEPTRQTNPGKWLLWHDPLLNFLRAHLSPGLPEHYARLAVDCAGAAARGTELDAHLRVPARLASILAKKPRLHLTLGEAARAKDAAALREIADGLPALRDEIRELWRLHRGLWHELYKPFGWETIERRYGGLLLRLETLGDKLDAFLADPTTDIADLSNEPMPVYNEEGYVPIPINHAAAASPSVIA